MKNNGYVITNIPVDLSKDPGDLKTMVAAGQSRSAQSVAARRDARRRVTEQYEEGRQKYTPKTQPRDPAGKFRQVLARLKLNLGDQETEQLAKQIEAAEAAGSVGDYAKAREAGSEVIKLLDAVDTNAIEAGTVDNLREGSNALGEVMAYLPLPQGDSSAKVRFSDLPPATGKLIRDLLQRVDEKLDAEDAAKYTEVLNSFLSGGRTMAADELSAEFSKLLRVLA